MLLCLIPWTVVTIELKPAGRVPPDAFLFVQANKKEAKNGFFYFCRTGSQLRQETCYSEKHNNLSTVDGNES
jgi:hypothetical protein